MIISPSTRRLSTPSLGKGLLVDANKVGGIVKVFDVVPSIPLMSVFCLANEILYRAVLIFFNCLLIKQTLYFKEFNGVGVIVDKHGGWHVRAGMMGEIIGWGRCCL